MSEWLAYFEGNASADHEIAWTSEDPAIIWNRKALAESLSHFALGESGDGRRIRALGAKAGIEKREPAYLPAVERFVKEENRHAEMLDAAVLFLGGKKTLSHWTETMFITLRRMMSLKTEIQVLAIAEVIGITFYRMVGERTPSPAIKAMCAIFLKEEAEHLRFDADAIRWLCGGTPNLLRRLCAYVLFFGAITAAWVDHQKTLKALGYSFVSWVKLTIICNEGFNRHRDSV